MGWLPYVNIVLGVVGFGWLLGRTSSRWSEYPDEVRKLLGVLLGVFFALVSTSVEMVSQPNRLMVAAVVIFIVKAATLWVLATTRTTKYRTGTRTANGNEGTNPNRDVL